MGVVQCFVIVSMLSAKLVLTSPLADEFYPMGSSECPMCPAGKYEESCAECKSCPAGYYTTELNREDSCHPCYGDCKPHLHLKVVQSCTSTSDLKCVCEDGFRCTDVVPLSTNCRYCVKIQRTTTTAAAVTSGEDKHMLSSASSGHSSTSVKPCKFPKCGPPSVPPARNDTHSKGDHTSSQLAAVLCPVVVVGCVALVILFCFWRSPGDETCFKQAIAKLCNEGGRDVSHKPKESTHQFPRDSFSAKQQPSCLSAANLGPVHVHNPGTVIFSLLSQFTGQVGPTIECGKTTERVNSEEEDERDCPVFHPTSSPTSSPSIHLSEEERSGEIDSIFFPSQEQGKDCHVSKEEAL
ncbi:tumor necrosis factor receptor superfamily member 14 isoform X2 [Sebastes umbrosus]|uniref:tumor necrosis factor receptor superfamily member 14 isoform X2 n=1 Tax=Sebastes umbrosus TaxID=72105 RepID=UPI0018A126C0|nr:tumor necrosis factor receptor superfamily member 14 isoform X2 [Sebastes umbrosus]